VAAWRFGAAAGALTGALSFRSGHYDAGPTGVSSLIAAALLAIAVCHLRERRIPNRVTYPLLAGTVGVAWAWPDRPANAVFMAGCAVALASRQRFSPWDGR
jgi:predicted branched-subunit amino acid permease